MIARPLRLVHLVAGGDFAWDQRLIRHGAIVGQCRRMAKAH